MIKIENKNDLKQIADPLCRAVAEAKLSELLTSYEIDNISCFGSIFLISDSSEFEDYSALGLTEPINQNFEFVDTITIKRCNREETYLFGCIIICDDLGVDLLVNKSLLTPEQLSRFKSNIVNQEYELITEV